MKLLIDTHAFLWYYNGSNEMSHHARTMMDNAGNDFYVSVASFREIGIKVSIGKLTPDQPLDVFFREMDAKGFNILPVSLSHILKSSTLKFHHRDPFDRLLIAQAHVEKMDVVTKDPLFDPYANDEPFKIIW